MSYNEYLKSTDWKEKRTKKLKKCKKRCMICGTKEGIFDVHHLNYKNLIDVTPLDLKIFCRRCHELSHKLHKEGKIVFRSDKPGSRYQLIKNAIKRELGIVNKNMFREPIK